MKTKTITIDYDMYRQELLDAQQRGFEVVVDLKADINQIAKDFRGYDSETRNSAIYKLEYIITRLNKLQLDLPVVKVHYTSGQD